MGGCATAGAARLLLSMRGFALLLVVASATQFSTASAAGPGLPRTTSTGSRKRLGIRRELSTVGKRLRLVSFVWRAKAFASDLLRPKRKI